MPSWGVPVGRRSPDRANALEHGSTPRWADGIVSRVATYHPETQRLRSFDAIVHYLVDSPDGPVGVIDGWESNAEGQPQSLVVVQGWFGRRRLTVPIEDVLHVDHERRSVLVARHAAPLDRGRQPPYRTSGE
jgi:hypothetical protein